MKSHIVCTFYIRKSAFLCEIYSNHHLMIMKMTILGLVKFQVKLKRENKESEMRIYKKVIEVKRTKGFMLFVHTAGILKKCTNKKK